ncbi:hypothetical protein U1Q18_016535 [Sarracenia purpurea var. burkii]
MTGNNMPITTINNNPEFTRTDASLKATGSFLCNFLLLIHKDESRFPRRYQSVVVTIVQNYEAITVVDLGHHELDFLRRRVGAERFEDRSELGGGDLSVSIGVELAEIGSTSFWSPGDVSKVSSERLRRAEGEFATSVCAAQPKVCATRPRDRAARSRFGSTELDPLLDMGSVYVDGSLSFRSKIGLFCSCFVLVPPPPTVNPSRGAHISSINWVLIVVPVKRQHPPRRNLPGTVDRVVVTSDADDGGAGVRALKAFFKMKGFTSVAEAARISLTVLAGTTQG